MIVLFDDILVYSMDWATHLHYLQLVLEVLQENHLLVKLSKCNFDQKQIGYLGHIVSNEGISVDPAKIEAI